MFVDQKNRSGHSSAANSLPILDDGACTQDPNTCQAESCTFPKCLPNFCVDHERRRAPGREQLAQKANGADRVIRAA